MKKLKLLITTLVFVLMVTVLSTSVFAETITYNYIESDASNIYVFFEKPDSWASDDVYVNFVDSQTSNLAFDEPGVKMNKVLEKASYGPVFTITNDIYALPISLTPLQDNHFDQVIFTSGTQQDKTVPATLVSYKRYIVDGGEGLNQTTATPDTKLFDITLATTLEQNLENLNEINPDLYQTLKRPINKLIYDVQYILSDPPFSSFNESFNRVITNKDIIKDAFQKDPNSVEELRKKIAEANEKINEDGYTEDSIQTLANEIPNAQHILDNEQYFTQDQIDSETETLDNLIKGLVPITTDLEKLIEEAKTIDPDKYTDESGNNLKTAIDDAEKALEDKSNLTLDKVKELTKNLKDAIDGLEEKKVKNESNNPATGDILAIILPLLALASVAGIFTFVYSKKQK